MDIKEKQLKQPLQQITTLRQDTRLPTIPGHEEKQFKQQVQRITTIEPICPAKAYLVVSCCKSCIGCFLKIRKRNSWPNEETKRIQMR